MALPVSTTLRDLPSTDQPSSSFSEGISSCIHPILAEMLMQQTNPLSLDLLAFKPTRVRTPSELSGFPNQTVMRSSAILLLCLLALAQASVQPSAISKLLDFSSYFSSFMKIRGRDFLPYLKSNPRSLILFCE